MDNSSIWIWVKEKPWTRNSNCGKTPFFLLSDLKMLSLNHFFQCSKKQWSMFQCKTNVSDLLLLLLLGRKKSLKWKSYNGNTKKQNERETFVNYIFSPIQIHTSILYKYCETLDIIIHAHIGDILLFRNHHRIASVSWIGNQLNKRK